MKDLAPEDWFRYCDIVKFEKRFFFTVAKFKINRTFILLALLKNWLTNCVVAHTHIYYRKNRLNFDVDQTPHSRLLIDSRNWDHHQVTKLGRVE